MKKPGTKFKWRVFSSFGLAWSFLLIVLTGIVLYFAPAGRVARWIDWDFVWLDRNEWIAVHTVFSYVFIGFACFHLFVFNWKSFLAYLRRKSSRVIHRRRELVWASAISLGIFLGTLLNIPPIGSVMSFGNYLSNLWGRDDLATPFPHTEKMTIPELSEKISFLHENDAYARLTQAGLQHSGRLETLAEIGKTNSMSPSEVLRIILGEEGNIYLRTIGIGNLGDYRIRDIPSLTGISREKVSAILIEAGIGHSADDQLRDVARAHGTTPGKILKQIKEGSMR